MTDREIMQQALDSLITCEVQIESEWGVARSMEQIEADGDASPVILALRERLSHCDRCGKKLGGEGDIHTCTPKPDAYGYASRLAVAIWEQHYKDVAPQWKPLDDLMGVLTQIDNMTTGLTRLAQPEQEPVAYDKTELNCFAQDLYDQTMREGKRGHYESMFHVIHQCIKKVAPQPKPPTA